MRPFRSFVLMGIALWPVAGQPAAAATFTLGEAERLDAIRAGQKSIVSDEFGGQWTTRDGGGQSLTVMTPYHRLALAARNAAFKKEPLRPKDIEALLKETQGKLGLWVTLRGGRSDFARNFEPVLLDGGTEVAPSFVQNERTALREDDGRYTARCVYVFPADGLNPKGRVSLVVRDPDGKEMAKFIVDLSAVR